MIINYLETYSFLADTPKLREQLTLENDFINFTKLVLSGSHSRANKLPPYVGYKDYETDVSYWYKKGNTIKNSKAIIFPVNEQTKRARVDRVIMYNSFGTVKIECRFNKTIFLSPGDTIGFHADGIYVVVK